MTQPNEQKEKWILASVPNELFAEAKGIYYNAPSNSMRFFGHDPLELLESQLQQTREELEYEQKRFALIRDKESINDTRIMELRQELEQVKAERDELKLDLAESEQKFGALEYANIDNLHELESFHTELAAKDKVLQWIPIISELKSIEPEEIIRRIAKNAESLIQSYPPREKGADNEQRD